MRGGASPLLQLKERSANQVNVCMVVTVGVFALRVSFVCGALISTL